MGKTDEILNHIIDIKGRMGKIEGHLDKLNGQVLRNMKDIRDDGKTLKEHDKRQDGFDRKLAYYGGGITVLFTLVNLALNHFLFN